VADVFDPVKRSQVMSRIRSSSTRPEQQLYELVRSLLGGRWRIDRNVGGLPGKPDLVIPSLKVAVYLDGCFFHACPRHGRIPDSNRDYWEPKLTQNVRRDARNRRQLRELGYHVWRLWEHDFETSASRQQLRRRLAARLFRALGAPGPVQASLLAPSPRPSPQGR
jgi:DNA mismatch endonuclease (patch repair protein)